MRLKALPFMILFLILSLAQSGITDVFAMDQDYDSDLLRYNTPYQFIYTLNE